MFGKNFVQKIMIVEDDELIRKELSHFLTYEGYEAVCIEKFENDFQTAERKSSLRRYSIIRA